MSGALFTPASDDASKKKGGGGVFKTVRCIDMLFFFFLSPGAVTERRIETSHRDEDKIDHKPLACKKPMIIIKRNESEIWVVVFILKKQRDRKRWACASRLIEPQGQGQRPRKPRSKPTSAKVKALGPFTTGGGCASEVSEISAGQMRRGCAGESKD